MAGLSGVVFPDEAQYRRDFDWLISCPSLLQGCHALETAAPSDGQELDFRPVEAFLNSKAAYRVGYYAEALLDCWLGRVVKPDEVQRSLQIQEENRTVGELDFLYRTGQRLHHLEVALKFYLYCPEENHTGSHLVGPNAADTFERKRNRFLTHQLPLGRERFPEVESSEIIMKGVIFYPPGIDAMEKCPEGLNPEHRRGVWIRESEISWIEGISEVSGGFLLDKPFWLSGVPHSESVSQVVCAVQQHFEARRHPVFLTLKGEDSRERQRVFVVPDSWPAEL